MYSAFLSLLNLNPLEELRYSVLLSQGPFEVRFYPRRTCLKFTLPGDFETSLKEGLNALEEYFSGNNFKVSKIERSGPFFFAPKADAWEISTWLPMGMNALTAPKPINRFVRIEEAPPCRVGVLKFGGPSDKDTFKRKSEELMKWLTHRKLSFTTPFRAYKPDYALPVPFLRQNEVYLDLI